MRKINALIFKAFLDSPHHIADEIDPTLHACLLSISDMDVCELIRDNIWALLQNYLSELE